MVNLNSGLNNLLLKLSFIVLLMLGSSSSLGMSCVELFGIKGNAINRLSHSDGDNFRGPIDLPFGMNLEGFSYLIDQFQFNPKFQGYVMIVLYGSRVNATYGLKPTLYSDLDVAFVQKTPNLVSKEIKGALRKSLASELELPVSSETPNDFDIESLLRSKSHFSPVKESDLVRGWQEFQRDFQADWVRAAIPVVRDKIKQAWNQKLDDLGLKTFFHKGALILLRQNEDTDMIVRELQRRDYHNIVIVE